VDRKKQLLHRIYGWGYEKNVKKDERRAIIERLGPEVGSLGETMLRGRRLDKAKLNRWMKLEKSSNETSPTSEVLENSSGNPSSLDRYWRLLN
jgi:hypothetical protein